MKCDWCIKRAQFTLRHPMTRKLEEVCDDHSQSRIGNGWAIITRWL